MNLDDHISDEDVYRAIRQGVRRGLIDEPVSREWSAIDALKHARAHAHAQAACSGAGGEIDRLWARALVAVDDAIDAFARAES